MSTSKIYKDRRYSTREHRTMSPSPHRSSPNLAKRNSLMPLTTTTRNYSSSSLALSNSGKNSIPASLLAPRASVIVLPTGQSGRNCGEEFGNGFNAAPRKSIISCSFDPSLLENRNKSKPWVRVRKLLKKLLPKKNIVVTFFGLHGCGKTSIMYKLKFGEIISTGPTIRYNVECLTYDNTRFVFWDFDDSEFWVRFRHSLKNSRGVVFVVDSSKPKLFAEAKILLKLIIAHPELEEDAAFVILAHKQDLPEAVDPEKLETELDLCHILDGHRWILMGKKSERRYMARVSSFACPASTAFYITIIIGFSFIHFFASLDLSKNNKSHRSPRTFRPSLASSDFSYISHYNLSGLPICHMCISDIFRIHVLCSPLALLPLLGNTYKRITGFGV